MVTRSLPLLNPFLWVGSEVTTPPPENQKISKTGTSLLFLGVPFQVSDEHRGVLVEWYPQKQETSFRFEGGARIYFHPKEVKIDERGSIYAFGVLCRACPDPFFVSFKSKRNATIFRQVTARFGPGVTGVKILGIFLWV